MQHFNNMTSSNLEKKKKKRNIVAQVNKAINITPAASVVRLDERHYKMIHLTVIFLFVWFHLNFFKKLMISHCVDAGVFASAPFQL